MNSAISTYLIFYTLFKLRNVAGSDWFSSVHSQATHVCHPHIICIPSLVDCAKVDRRLRFFTWTEYRHSTWIRLEHLHINFKVLTYNLIVQPNLTKRKKKKSYNYWPMFIGLLRIYFYQENKKKKNFNLLKL